MATSLTQRFPLLQFSFLKPHLHHPRLHPLRTHSSTYSSPFFLNHGSPRRPSRFEKNSAEPICSVRRICDVLHPVTRFKSKEKQAPVYKDHSYLSFRSMGLAFSEPNRTFPRDTGIEVGESDVAPCVFAIFFLPSAHHAFLLLHPLHISFAATALHSPTPPSAATCGPNASCTALLDVCGGAMQRGLEGGS